MSASVVTLFANCWQLPVLCATDNYCLYMPDGKLDVSCGVLHQFWLSGKEVEIIRCQVVQHGWCLDEGGPGGTKYRSGIASTRTREECQARWATQGVGPCSGDKREVYGNSELQHSKEEAILCSWTILHFYSMICSDFLIEQIIKRVVHIAFAQPRYVISGKIVSF